VRAVEGPPAAHVDRRTGFWSPSRMSTPRNAKLRATSLVLLVAAGCAGKYAPTQRMTSIQASLDKGAATQVFAKALVRSPTAEGLCAASFSWDDPRPTATQEAFSIQAYRRGEEVGRVKQKDYQGKESTVIEYRKDRYVEERRFADITKVRVTRDPNGMCSRPAPRGKAAITLHTSRVEVPIILAVDDLDTVLAALAVLAPQAPVVEGAGI
jgi:hypothetical protein